MPFVGVGVSFIVLLGEDVGIVGLITLVGEVIGDGAIVVGMAEVTPRNPPRYSR
jgi:hypothetical protein